MSKGNLELHEWIMTTYPEIVAEYIQYDDTNMLTAPTLQIKVQLHYEPTKLGVPKGIKFQRQDFIRPGTIRATALPTNLDRRRNNDLR